MIELSTNYCFYPPTTGTTCDSGFTYDSIDNNDVCVKNNEEGSKGYDLTDCYGTYNVLGINNECYESASSSSDCDATHVYKETA